ncbi:MAG: LemA family protein [Verrucomicrobiota bacterium]
MELLGILGFVFLGGGLLVLILIYNGFIGRRNAMRNAFASIDVQLKKRWELVPNLVETVRGFAKHEKEVFEGVIEARNAAQVASAESGERFAQEREIEVGMNRLFALAESYPELKSSEHFLNLQRNLTEVESQISASRRAYLAAVQDWNNGVESFPGVIFAGVWNFERAAWFEVKAEEREGVDVRLS